MGAAGTGAPLGTQYIGVFVQSICCRASSPEQSCVLCAGHCPGDGPGGALGRLVLGCFSPQSQGKRRAPCWHHSAVGKTQHPPLHRSLAGAKQSLLPTSCGQETLGSI